MTNQHTDFDEPTLGWSRFLSFSVLPPYISMLTGNYIFDITQCARKDLSNYIHIKTLVQHLILKNKGDDPTPLSLQYIGSLLKHRIFNPSCAKSGNFVWPSLISWQLMPWLLASPGHLTQWFLLCGISVFQDEELHRTAPSETRKLVRNKTPCVFLQNSSIGKWS